ncbi:MAG: hypothetical protein EAZ23_06485 [Oscillatoriales cyanobacterium]|nr:MAG: hypothetical protein EAZ23_06485 [Oscillatoriales cyanobacterium]
MNEIFFNRRGRRERRGRKEKFLREIVGIVPNSGLNCFFDRAFVLQVCGVRGSFQKSILQHHISRKLLFLFDL